MRDSWRCLKEKNIKHWMSAWWNILKIIHTFLLAKALPRHKRHKNLKTFCIVTFHRQYLFQKNPDNSDLTIPTTKTTFLLPVWARQRASSFFPFYLIQSFPSIVMVPSLVVLLTVWGKICLQSSFHAAANKYLYFCYGLVYISIMICFEQRKHT